MLQNEVPNNYKMSLNYSPQFFIHVYIYIVVKAMNRHIWSMVNFVVTVGGAFAFGYKGTEYAFPGYNNHHRFMAVCIACI